MTTDLDLTTPDLDLTTRAALDRVLYQHDATGLTDDERAALFALRDACPEPPWLPKGDGIVVYVGTDGVRRLYHVRDGKVGSYLRPDGTLLYPADPADFDGTWEPYVHEVTTGQIDRAARVTLTDELNLRTALPHLGCREVTR